ncbi:sigma-70 family RNA polymerase sigma factor [Mycolicibacillus parakoreensis]|uniref:RNA polymerase sigma factor n=1 Tax=Mycolicibacillus parakoreensis TaxID=1069221 RepID=A0ABY3U2N2_9MYCO|nr:sigma-70 family RNA polymerase sigma factor [Mycolicibacillus parakoreensis]MCV7314758.1 sigma-70 family RNA polymerase sigma factor [Mycolicibacillus parakoreensis]ULN53762.1 sigma-70 family RNA polymerase sigma factor [Mycolicibacillus parakoreensis]
MPVSTRLGDPADIAAVLAPFRREIRAHCYRMTGCVHDAEDLTQETYLRAWRAFPGFEHRSSLRTWLYRIATNVCLTHLGQRSRRPLPTGLGTAPADPRRRPREGPGAWVEPMPDAWLWSAAPVDPGEHAVGRDSVRIAFVAALHHLGARPRAVLLLRDVVGCTAREVAEVLDMSVAGVNSTLHRARVRLSAVDATALPALPQRPADRRLLDAYLRAFERYDMAALVEVLAADAVWEMPPFAGWYHGAAQIATLIATWCPARHPGDMLLRRTAANGLPVFAVYLRDTDGVHRAFQLQQLSIGAGGVHHVTAWFAPELFSAFGLPATVAVPSGQRSRTDGA